MPTAKRVASLEAEKESLPQALLFLEEMASILLTPFILYFSLPKCASAITQFVAKFSQNVEGLGDVCSLAAFDLKQHGNWKYGSPHQGPKVRADACRSNDTGLRTKLELLSHCPWQIML